MTAHTLPMGQRKTISYDDDGRQTAKTDFGNKQTTFVYDASDRLVETRYDDGTGVSYTYTPGGQIETATDVRGTTTYSYDIRDRLRRQDNPDGSYLAYTYDSQGNVLGIETPGTTVSFTYDARNRKRSVTDASGTTTYDFDAVDNLITTAYPNGTQTHRTYNSRNWITSIRHYTGDGQRFASFDYQYDASGNRTQVVEANGRTVNYLYDDQYRLIQETVTNDPNGNDTVTEFTYDRVGNRTGKTVDGFTTTYEFDANDRLVSDSQAAYAFNDAGNLISDGVKTYDYDAQNRLTQVITPDHTYTYGYDYKGNRVSKTVNGQTTTYLIDGNTRYAKVLRESNATSSIDYTYGLGLISQHGVNTRYFHTDAIGSTRALSDATGTPVDQFDYSPYGIMNGQNSNATHFLYAGEQFDAETDGYYLRARYYAPNQGRFLTVDPFKGHDDRPVTLHDYIYAGDNPVMFVDPSGENFLKALNNVTLQIAVQIELFAIRRPIVAMSVEGMGSIIAPFEMTATTPYVWTGIAAGTAFHTADQMIHMSGTAAVLKRTEYFLKRLIIGIQWQHYVINNLWRSKITSTQYIRFKDGKKFTTTGSGYVIPDAYIGSKLVEIKTTGYGGSSMYHQAEEYAKIVVSKQDQYVSAIDGVIYKFLVKPPNHVVDELDRIFKKEGAPPPQIFWVFHN